MENAPPPTLIGLLKIASTIPQDMRLGVLFDLSEPKRLVPDKSPINEERTRNRRRNFILRSL
jgi:hypothetical protein